MSRLGSKGDKRLLDRARKRPSLFRFAVNKLAMDLSSAVVDNQYFKVLIVPKAVIAEVLRDLFAMFDCFSIRVELKADAVSHRDAVFHIEKKLAHGHPRFRDSGTTGLRCLCKYGKQPDYDQSVYASKGHAETNFGRKTLSEAVFLIHSGQDAQSPFVSKFHFLSVILRGPGTSLFEDFAAPGDRTGCLRWCHQLTLKPRVCAWRSHRVNQFGHDLVDVIASGALKRPDLEARGAWCNPRQHRCRLARWT
jgi:hypothetical protein